MRRKLYSLSLLALSAAGVCLFVGCSSGGDDVDNDVVVPDVDDDSSSDVVTEFPVAEVISSIPTPPAGQRWIVNDDFTDEFNDSEIDLTKWNNYHSNWAGREPALFLPKNVYLDDGCFVTTASTLSEQEVTDLKVESQAGAYGGIYKNITYGPDNYNIAGGALSSVKETAGFGYYEARIKGNKTNLSTTFWLSSKLSGTAKFTVAESQPSSLSSDPTYADLTYNEEIDILECVGYIDGNTSWPQYMHSNAHIKFSSSTVDNLDMDNFAESHMFPPYDGTGRVYDQFNTYGCWWRDRENVSFYLNNDDGTHGVFQCDNTMKYFYMNGPMGLNMVMESYSWVGSPTDAELVDDSGNKNYCDWVRAYVLVDSDQATASGTSEMTMFEDLINVSYANSTAGVTFNIHYTAPVDRELMVALYDKSGTCLYTAEMDAPAGYSNIEHKFSYPSVVILNSTYYVAAFLGEVGSSDLSKDYISADSFDFKF